MATEQEPLGDERRKIFGWLSTDLAITVVSLLVAIVMAFGNVKSDVRDLDTRVDEHDKSLVDTRASMADTHRLLMDLNAKVEVLLERTNPRQP